MNAVENQVRELVAVELESANRQFPQFHSPLSAVYAACEAIQVAAMAEKLLNMEETR